MLVIAGNITTRNRTIAETLKQRPAELASPKATARLNQQRAELLQNLAKQCVSAGADILDINLQHHHDRPEIMKLAVRKIQEVADVQLCLSSNSPQTLEAGLRECKRPPLVNYVSLDEEKLERILPLAARYRAGVVLLPTDMTAPADAADIMKSAAVLVGAANEAGISNDRIMIDPGVFHITSDVGQRHLQTLTKLLPALAEAFDPPLRTTCWINNISAGIPRRLRSPINRVFLAMLAGLGLSCAFVDALDKEMMRTIRTVRILKSEIIYSERDLEL